MMRPFQTPLHTAPYGQQGLGLLGFAAAALPVLTLGMGGVELAHWMQLRQTLSLMLADAARAGITRQAQPQAVAQAFEAGLHQLYPAPGAAARILRERQHALGLPWHIAIQRPTHAAFIDHADPGLRGSRAQSGQVLIRNEGQARQHAARLAQGWAQGRGPASGLTIYEANTLRLALRWPHRPLLPGASALIKTLAPLAQDTRNRQWMAAGYLPFRRQVTFTMQSPPALWPDLADGRVTHEAEAAAVTPPVLAPVPVEPATAPGPGDTPPVAGNPDTPLPPAADPGHPPAGSSEAPAAEAGPNVDPALCE